MTVQDRPVFAFTGQGAQYPGMTADLAERVPGYLAHVRKASDALERHLGESVAELILGGDERIELTGRTQPALFAVQYALTATLAEAGVVPGAVIGHSIGEFAAAVCAGALTLEDGALLTAHRGALMQALPSGGGMLAAGCAQDGVADLLAAEPGVGIAAHNGPKALTLSGACDALDRIAAVLGERGVRVTRLKVSHAFHSVLMRPMLEPFGRIAGRVRPAVPRIGFYSTVRGAPLGPGEALDAGYWVEHAAAPVRFAQAAGALLREARPAVVVEIGPKPVLCGLLRKLAPGTGTEFLPSCRGGAADPLALREVVARCTGTTTR